MKYEHLGQFSKPLDAASGGLLSAFAAECARRGLELHVYVLTHLEGLAEGKMQLCVHALDSDGTAARRTVSLGPLQHELGWNLYLHERTTSVRNHLARARERLDALDRAQPSSSPPETT